MRAAVLTASDRCSRGKATDTSGPHIAARLCGAGFEVVATTVVPDERETIAGRLNDWIAALALDVIVTTGGTGFSVRDVTPEATLDVIDRRASGIAEAIRAAGMAHTPRACLSRGEAGLAGTTLIVNLPGSLEAVREGMDVLVELLPHAVRMIAGEGH